MTENKSQEPQLLNVQKAASFLGVSPSSIRQWALSNKLKGVKIGTRGDWRFSKDELSKLIQVEKDKFIKIKKFLKQYASEIQKISSEKKEFLIDDEKKQDESTKLRKKHVLIVKKLADNLNDIEKGRKVFNKLGEKLALQAVADGLTLESAVDGTIFIKQSIWEKLEQEGLLYQLTTQDFYKISNLVSIYTDILASKIAFAYHDFITSNLNFLQISDALPAMIAVYNIHTGKYIYVNKSITKILGYSPKDFMSKGMRFVSTLVHPDDMPIVMEKNINALKEANKKNHAPDKDPIISFEYRMRHKNGKWIWLLTEGSVFSRDKNGKVESVLNASIDITERKKMEEKAKIEAGFKLIAETIPHMVFVANAKGENDYFNNQWWQYTALDPRKGLKDAWIKIIYPDDLAILRKRWQKAMKKLTTFEAEYRLKKYDGTYQWFLIRSVPIKDSNKNIVRWFGTATNIHERKQTEEALKQSEAYLRALVTATSDVIYRMSSDWKVMHQLDGRNFLADTGKPDNKWLQKYIHPNDQKKVMKVIKDAIRKKSIFQLEHQVKTADGSLGWTSSRAVPILDAKGNITEWFGAASDITERKHAELAIQEAKELSEQQKRLYEAITGSTPDLIYVFDLDYKFIYANEALLKMWGLTWEESKGKRLLEIGYEPWHAEMHEREIDKLIRTKQPIRGEVAFPHATLGKRIYDYIFVPVLDAKGKVTAVAGTARDITELRRLSQQKDEFISMASHELKTPITSAKMFIDILEKETSQYNNKLTERYLGRLRELMSRLQIIVGDLLDVSRIETGKMYFSKDKFNLVQVLADTIEAIQPITHSHIISLSSDSNLPVTADRFRIYQVITNLLTNAIKYSPKGGKITVTARKENDSAVVSVKDTGIGITKKQQEKIFEKLYQVADLREKTTTGLGMGLYISKEIIRRHKGKIWVKSTKGKGSTFFFSLPLSNTKK